MIRFYRDMADRIEDLASVEECEGFVIGLRVSGRELTPDEQSRFSRKKIALEKMRQERQVVVSGMSGQKKPSCPS